jgi:AhpD family alkylhydroperoxidase
MLTKIAIALTLTAALFAAPAAHADSKSTLKEIEGAFGFVPAFIKSIPETLLPGTWDQIKSLEMNPNTALDNRTKELIGLAVASTIPCEFCIYFHTRAAKANGATDQMIAEAVGMAALTRAGSTLLHGTQQELGQYKKDVDRILKPRAK